MKSESEVAQLCPTLCNPMDCILPGSSLHGILQAIVLEWGAISFSRGSSQPRDRTRVSHIPGRRFNLWATKVSSIVCVHVCAVTQLCPALCDSMDCSLPGSYIHGIFQARILEWVAISFRRGSSWLRDQTCVLCVSCIAGRCFTCWAIGEVPLYPNI